MVVNVEVICLELQAIMNDANALIAQAASLDQTYAGSELSTIQAQMELLKSEAELSILMLRR